ncbi:hypothetical protein T4D_3559 [Trichinella pseudospiralis]|uniref:Uncharacterized protein n=1 Tax=Trichinella pseudospiralis TaxID=6337 RepID=A0A0V1F459_TRIPS|nr:hypothetical protein T4D_3559 [Trichinella pseudospiralis]
MQFIKFFIQLHQLLKLYSSTVSLLQYIKTQDKCNIYCDLTEPLHHSFPKAEWTKCRYGSKETCCEEETWEFFSILVSGCNEGAQKASLTLSDLTVTLLRHCITKSVKLKSEKYFDAKILESPLLVDWLRTAVVDNLSLLNFAFVLD